MAYQTAPNATPSWLSKYRALLEAGRQASAKTAVPPVKAPRTQPKKKVLPAINNRPPTSMYIPPGPEPGSYTPPGFDTTFGHSYGPVDEVVVPEKKLPDISTTYQRMMESGDLTPVKEPYRDEVPRLFDYAQQAEKFGTFEDYQKAVDARKHGFVPDDYKDLAGVSDPSGSSQAGGDQGYPDDPGGYPYPSFSKSTSQKQQGIKPNWSLWATFITQTTWNV